MKNKGSFVSRNSILCEYKKLYSYDENFLTDEIMKQVISRVGKILIDRLIEFTNRGEKASHALIETFDPSPEEVPQNGDPIGLKGPCGGQIGWAGLVVYKEVRDYLEDIKDFL
jgi:hypothetical protein